MGYTVVDPYEYAAIPDRPCETHAVTGNRSDIVDFQHLGVRIYDPAPGEQVPLQYHYHEEQEEALYVINGTLHVETPGKEYVVNEGEFFVVEPGSPHRAYNPASATGPVRVLGFGAPTYDGGNRYTPDS